MGPESLLARKPSFWLSKQAIEEHVLLRHTASVARACTLKSTHHTRSYISCMISKFKKTLLTLSSLVLLFFQNALSRQCQSQGKTTSAMQTLGSGRWFGHHPSPCFVVSPPGGESGLSKTRLCACRHLYPEGRSLGRPNPGFAKPHPPQEQTATLGQ